MSADRRFAGDGRGASRVSTHSYRSILVEEVVEGLGELRRETGGLLMSGLSAGLDIGFSVLLMATALTLLEAGTPEIVERLLLANLYAVGFILVILGRSDLFTEHTALAVFPVLAGQASLRALGRLWALVYVSNIAGALLFSAVLVIVGPRLDIIEPSAFGAIAAPLVGHSWWLVVASAVLAGWLLGLLSWLLAASQETFSRIVLVWLIAATIGFAHLHHAIVGTVEVAGAWFAGEGVDAGQFAHFLLWTTLGNAVGGAALVALVKYGHVVRGGPTEEAEERVRADTRLAERIAPEDAGDAGRPPPGRGPRVE